MSKSTSVKDHINTLNTIFTTSNFHIVENERAEVLLQNLPDSYDQVVIDMINNNVVDRLYLDDVARVILEEESKRVNKEDHQESDRDFGKSM